MAESWEPCGHCDYAGPVHTMGRHMADTHPQVLLDEAEREELRAPDRYAVLDAMTRAARGLGWHNVGASTSEHWAALTVTDGLVGLPRDHMYRVSSVNVSAHMTLEQIANWLSEHPDEPVEINYPADLAASVRTFEDLVDKADNPRYQELMFAASEVVTAYDSNESMGDWAARLENCVAILRELVK